MEEKFIPPTEKQVINYCEAGAYLIPPKIFIEFYKKRNWKNDLISLEEGRISSGYTWNDLKNYNFK